MPNLIKDPALHAKISLRKEIVTEVAKSRRISVQNARVVFVLDHSGSMRALYRNGTVQDVLERIFPVAMHFDDNAELEFYWFDSFYKELEPVTCDSIQDYVPRVILEKNEHFGGTCYAPVMQALMQRYVAEEPAEIPTFVIFITDGNNSDKAAAKRALTEASAYNIFWKFVGIGFEQFEFLQKLDDLSGRTADNANFVRIRSLTDIDDRTLYDMLLTEYAEWLAACRACGIPVDGAADPAEQLRSILQEKLPGCTLQEEDTPDVLKLHVYLADSRKFGIVKIGKTDKSLQLRKLAGGAPQTIGLASADDLKRHLSF